MAGDSLTPGGAPTNEMTRAEAVTKIVRHGLAILKIVVIYFGLQERFRHFFKFDN